MRRVACIAHFPRQDRLQCIYCSFKGLHARGMRLHLEALHFGEGHLDEALSVVGVAAEGDGHVSVAVLLGAARRLCPK